MPRIETTIVADESGTEVQRTERKQYTLAELKAIGGAGYDRALEKLAEWSMDYEWWDTLLDSERDEIAEKYGITFDPKDVTFDLDRGSFFAFGKASVDERVLLKRAGLDLRSKDARTIIEHGLVMGTTHYGGGIERGWIGLYQYDDIPDWVCSDETAEAIRDVLREAQDDMLTALREEQEYLTSKDHLLEWAEGNDWLFYENGAVAA